MQLTVGSDHAGFPLKESLAAYLRKLGHQVIDVGTHSTDPVDYPDFAEAVADVLRRGDAERGILVCGSGVGASIAANKIPGIRAGLCHDTYSAHQGVEHEDVNILVLGARVIGPVLAQEIVDSFLRAKFSAEERHARRLGKLQAIEARYSARASTKGT
jgi:ribose 5-phosphate isomerase B